MMANEKITDLCIGIDLGTTNSVLATVNQKPNGDLVSSVVDLKRAVDVYTCNGQVKPQFEKRSTLPSCIYYNEDKGYYPVVGNFAKDRYAVRPHLTVKSIKSHMGEKDISHLGYADELPDKTPAEISARILQHMLKEASGIFHHQIQDAVITVPANFDSIMVKATRDAAALAGIKVVNDDGTERPIILEEPKAVLYDFINKAANGEISNYILDLSTKKNVMVFDLGGGTLDITLHEVRRREDNPEIIKVDDIAINRYTLLGGDNFDQALAEKMYDNFLLQYANKEDIVRKLKKDKKAIMSQLLVYAENLKLDLSTSVENGGIGSSDNDGWGWDDEGQDGFDVGGNVGSTGYSYDDHFTQEDLETVFRPFMGENLSLKDYKNIENIGVLENTNNIVYPILDVLHKASKKLGTDEVQVDGVILNGGMSKFYMVKDRLKELFGFPPIEAMDPDLAVARGAAVYHYYLKKTRYAISDDMRTVGVDSSEPLPASAKAAAKPQQSAGTSYGIRRNLPEQKPVPQRVEWGRNIINESLYLGMSNNTRDEIIAAGTELPYSSSLLTGFQLQPCAKGGRIDVPIQIRNIDGKTFRTIASGQINFSQKYPNGSYVVLKVDVSSSKIITLQAWTCGKPDGECVIENGICKIEISDNEKLRQKKKLVQESGNKTHAVSALNSLRNVLMQKKKQRWSRDSQKEKSAIARQLATQIVNCSNPEDFADPIIKGIYDYNSCEEYRCRLFTIGRKLSVYWTDREKNRLSDAALEVLVADVEGLNLGLSRGGEIISTKVQAIYALAVCGTANQISRLKSLRNKPGYVNSCLYAYGMAHVDIPWLVDQLARDCDILLKGHGKRNVQNSAHAVGLAFRDYSCYDKNEEKLRNSAASWLLKALQASDISNTETFCCIIALGLVCDQRRDNKITVANMEEAENVLTHIERYVYMQDAEIARKCADIALKLIGGEQLNQLEEQFLLKKLEIAD